MRGVGDFFIIPKTIVMRNRNLRFRLRASREKQRTSDIREIGDQMKVMLEYGHKVCYTVGKKCKGVSVWIKNLPQN